MSVRTGWWRKLSYARGAAQRLILAALTGMFLMGGCGQAQVSTPPPVTIRIAGSTSAAPALLAWTAAFHNQHAHVVFDLRWGGSHIGKEQVASGEADLAVSTLTPRMTPVGEQETTPPLHWLPIGLDGLAIIVHPSNKIETLSLAQLRDLYHGRILDWKTLGSDKGEVLLISREDDSGLRQFFEDRVMGAASVSLTAVVMPSNGDVLDYVAEHPAAIGYISRTYVADQLSAAASAPITESIASPVETTTTLNDSRASNRVRLVAIEGKLPLLAYLKEQSYPLTLPVYLVVRQMLDGWPRQFLEFVLSPAGQELAQPYYAALH